MSSARDKRREQVQVHKRQDALRSSQKIYAGFFLCIQMHRRLSKSKSPFVREKTEAHVVKEFQPETEIDKKKKKS